MQVSLRIVAPFLQWIGLGAFVLSSTVWVGAEGAELRYPRKPASALSRIESVFPQLTIKKQSGRGDSHPSTLRDAHRLLFKIVAHRMRELGYAVVTDPEKPHDVTVRIECEESGHARPEPRVTPFALEIPQIVHHRPSAEPPCVLSYEFEGRMMPWQRVDRIIYAEGVEAAKRIARRKPTRGHSILMTDYLKHYDFPVLLTAEWGQATRLIDLYHDSGTTRARKERILRVLGEIRAEQGFSLLVTALADEELTASAARALGFYGAPARPILLELLTTTHHPHVQAAAANGLGRIGAMTGDAAATPTLLKVLTAPGTDIRVQTEIVWALGKAPDFSAHATLAQLEREIWMVHSHDPRMQRLREAVDWSIREVRQGGHTDDY